jgi:hypothetical protein
MTKVSMICIETFVNFEMCSRQDLLFNILSLYIIVIAAIVPENNFK